MPGGYGSTRRKVVRKTGLACAASVVDLGDPGKGNTFGSGRLLLGDPPVDTDGDGEGDACDLDDDNDGWYDVAEESIGTLPPQACGGANAWAPDSSGDVLVLSNDVFFITSCFFLTSSDANCTPRVDIGNLTLSNDVFAATSRFFTSCPPWGARTPVRLGYGAERGLADLTRLTMNI